MVVNAMTGQIMLLLLKTPSRPPPPVMVGLGGRNITYYVIKKKKVGFSSGFSASVNLLKEGQLQLQNSSFSA